MGNRIFLYTVDQMPGSEHMPAIRDAIAEANNFLPPLWTVLFSAAAPGPAQDAQQVFLPSVCGGIYAERGVAEQRLARLLDFIATHPLLASPDDFAERVARLKAALSTAAGTAYYGELNEFFWLGNDSSPEAMMDRFVRECAERWEQAIEAIGRNDHALVERLYGFTPRDAAAELGFGCWTVGEDGDEDDDIDSDPVGEGLYRFEQDGRFGLRRADGTIALPAIYDDIYDMDDAAQAGDLVQGGRIGMYGAGGELAMPPVLDELYEWSEGFAVARVGDRFGYVGHGGRWLVEPLYDDACDFSCGLARVTRDGLTGYLDATGREAIARQFLADSADFNACGVASVATPHGHGLIDTRGRQLADANYAQAEYLDGLQAWKLTHGSGRIDVFHPDGTPWLSGRFDDVAELEDGGDALVRIGDLFGTWRRDGQPGIPVAWRHLSMLGRQEDGETPGFAIYLVAAEDDGPVGACLDDGTVLAPPRFADIEVLQELLVPPGGYGTAVPDLFVVDAPDGGKALWSAAAQRLLLPAEYLLIHGFVAGGHALLLMYHPQWQWLIADRTGRWLYPHGYEGFSRRPAPLETRTAISAAYAIAHAWGEGKAAYARRNGQGWRLFADGTEVTEEAYLLARVRLPAATPIAATAQDVAHGAAYFGPHAIAGVGDAEACAALGDVYALGDGVAVDLHQACRWYATAAAAGDWNAMMSYARYLIDGKGCEADPREARRQLEALLAMYPDSRDACNLLGALHERGLGGECDPARARRLYATAAGTDRYGSDDGQYNLGRCWRDGIGGPADAKKALKWFELATIATPGTGRNGHAQACAAAAGLHRELARQAQARGNDKARQRHEARAGYFDKALAELRQPDQEHPAGST